LTLRDGMQGHSANISKFVFRISRFPPEAGAGV
jgi:hypothetical protein